VYIRHNPLISSFDIVGKHITQETAIPLQEIGFFEAVVISDLLTGEIKHDKRYVDFGFIVWENFDGKY
jgi:hypothetical protein